MAASSQKLSERQRKLGPAPFASFEDLSEDFSSPEDRAIEPMPDIEEEKEPKGGDHDVSGSTSTVQTPTTPRIDVENPSSPSQTSGESTPERELFSQLVGPIAGGFLETAADVDLRSSAEELVIPSDESNKRLTPRLGASSGRDRKVSWDAGDNRTANMSHERKGSASSIRSVDPIFFGAHNTRLSSFSSNVSGYSALSAASSAGSRRSPSPHRMLLETSFCGPKRNTAANDDDDIPKKSTLAPSSLSLGTTSPRTTSPLNSPMSPGYMRKLMVKYVKEPRSRPSSPFEHSRAPSPTPSRDREGSLNLGVCRKETRSPSPHRVTLETSFCGSKQTLPRQQDSEEPLYLLQERSNSLQPNATSRPHSPMPIRYTSEPRSRPSSPCPATLSTCSPLTSRRESRATTRSPSPHRAILETSFVGSKQIAEPDDSTRTPSFNGVNTELGKTTEKTLTAPVIYHREPRSRSASPVRRTSDETDNSSRQVSLKTFSSNDLDKEVSQLTASSTPSDDVIKAAPDSVTQQVKVQGTPRHLPKPVACPKPPQAFSQKSESLQAIPVDPSGPGKHLDVIDPIPAASSTPSTPFLGRKVSLDNAIRRGSISADEKYIQQDRRKDSADTLQSGSSDSPDVVVAKSILSDVKDEKKETKKSGVFSAFFRRGNKKNDKHSAGKDVNSLQPGLVSRDPSPGRSLGDSGLSADDLDDDETGSTAFNHQVLETSTDPTGKDHQSSGSEAEDQPKEPAHEPEKLGLFTQDSIEEDLPYVPTTLPLERPVAPPVIPARMRIAEVKTVPVERPRCSVSINPCSLNDYVRMTKKPSGQEADIKIKLSLTRRDESIDDPKPKPVPAVKVSLGEVVNWDSFAEKALRSPRVLRRVDSQETSWFPTESFANFSNWINPEEIPETAKQPKKIQPLDELKNSRKTSLSAVEEEKTIGEAPRNEETAIYEENSSVGSDERKRKNSASSETALLREVELEDDQDEEASAVDPLDVPSSVADPCSRLTSSSSSSESDMASEDEEDNGCLDAPLINRPATLLSTSPFGMDLDVRSNRSSIAVPSDVPSPDEISISTQS